MKKWRNKITGEINEFVVHKRIEDSEDGNPVYAPFDGHIDDWEDYEEPKRGWYIDLSCNDILIYEDICLSEEVAKKLKQIGNYFETKEEAELALRKLRAWKRLKDKGFRFNGKEVFSEGLLEIDGALPALERADDAERLKIIDDLDLLFGGEE